MDMFFAYLLVASATPLFIWLDNKKSRSFGHTANYSHVGFLLLLRNQRPIPSRPHTYDHPVCRQRHRCPYRRLYHLRPSAPAPEKKPIKAQKNPLRINEEGFFFIPDVRNDASHRQEGFHPYGHRDGSAPQRSRWNQG